MTSTGGISFFSAREGLVCDNVLAHEVVLGDGSIVTANRTTHPDLWLALKGGSNNFGIVTRFDIRTFPQSRFWGGLTVCPGSTADEHFRAYADCLHDFDPYVAILMSISWNQSADAVTMVASVHYTKEVQDPPVLRALTSIQPQLFRTLRTDSTTGFVVEMDKSNTPDRR